MLLRCCLWQASSSEHVCASSCVSHRLLHHRCRCHSRIHHRRRCNYLRNRPLHWPYFFFPTRRAVSDRTGRPFHGASAWFDPDRTIPHQHHHRRLPIFGVILFLRHRLVWSHMAYRLHGTEPIHLGTARCIHTSDTALSPEFCLVSYPKLEWRKAYRVRLV